MEQEVQSFEGNDLQLKKKVSSRQLKMQKKISRVSQRSDFSQNNEDDYDFCEDDDDDLMDFEEDDDDYDEYEDEEAQTLYRNFEHQNQGPKIIKDVEIFEQLQKKIQNDIQELTNLGFDKSLIIFRHYMFNQDQFNQNYFNDSEAIIKKYGLDMKDFKFLDQNVECMICFDDSSKGVELPCGNIYCEQCVASHIESKIQNKEVFFKCMEEDCNYMFQYSLINKVLDETKMDHVHKLYQLNLSRLYAEECKGIKWCPGVDCEYCIQDEYQQYTNVQCKNGHKFCFKCRLPAWHKPCPCKLVDDWNNKNNQNTLDEKWIQANTKKCPHCSRAIQRSLGCDFMRCAPPGGCGKAFCYVCMKPITENEHMNHASCKLKSDKDSQAQAKDYLAKVQTYFDNVKTCETVQKKAQEILDLELEEKRNTLYQKIGVSLQETQFLVEAFNNLIDSRDALKYSYIFAFQQFQMEGKMQNSQNLFENFQKNFSEHCETLAMTLENELNQFIEDISGFKDVQENGISDPNKINEFFQLKQKITAKYQAIDKSKRQMIEAVENGDIYLNEPQIVQEQQKNQQNLQSLKSGNNKILKSKKK
ncbi:hypothetical protein PPERSA_08771 [Pseudocohnilembus persalinus]|uniref:RBR-type E3 ubiquitin transferase n=1 Tax=Pseudocohnilembus persalinus TaxID=266149 RepID=A0A0V0R8A4_PSEPJ|nr:hypothetical protein PPERSA_08771 [Pseudocohnilembus persalinus]|eukprot:KRX10469.1 hypothetical protein PPERSA_08771 [Pseudocohnilembus persalinus]